MSFVCSSVCKDGRWCRAEIAPVLSKRRSMAVTNGSTKTSSRSVRGMKSSLRNASKASCLRFWLISAKVNWAVTVTSILDQSWSAAPAPSSTCSAKIASKSWSSCDIRLWDSERCCSVRGRIWCNKNPSLVCLVGKHNQTQNPIVPGKPQHPKSNRQQEMTTNRWNTGRATCSWKNSQQNSYDMIFQNSIRYVSYVPKKGTDRQSVILAKSLFN